MGRIKKGFSKGDIVICIQTLSPIITEGKEYVVDWYLHKNAKRESAICVKEDRRGLSKVVDCKYFVPKDMYYSKERNDKLNSILR